MENRWAAIGGQPTSWRLCVSGLNWGRGYGDMVNDATTVYDER